MRDTGMRRALRLFSRIHSAITDTRYRRAYRLALDRPDIESNVNANFNVALCLICRWHYLAY